MGASIDKESEIYHTTILPSGLHLYGGWFHVIGSIVSGGDAEVMTGPHSSKFEMDKYGEHFWVGPTCKNHLLPKTFPALPVVQLEFQAEVPWVIEEPFEE